ncbi:MAG: PDC sensor domain-containing protein [Candidatus Doudnabacteria bacterium]
MLKVKRKSILIISITSVILLTGVLVFKYQSKNLQPYSTFEQEQLDPILQNEIEPLIQLAQNPIIQEVLQNSNQSQNTELYPEQILALDQHWKETDQSDSFFEEFYTNPAAIELLKFQENHYGIPEIFLTGQAGFIIAQTNKTSDFYQADEEWWQKAYNQGQGQAYYDQIEFDESAQSQSIPIQVPVYDSNHQVIGVIKAIFDIVKIQTLL